MWASILAKVLGESVGSAALDYFRRKAELKQQLKLTEIEGKIAEAKAKGEVAAERQKHEASWELKSIENSGWKDEYWTIVLSAPLVLVFLPGLQPYIAQGFVELEKAPDWYLASVGVAVASAFGVRWLANRFQKNK